LFFGGPGRSGRGPALRLLLGACLAAVLFAGCSSSSPRFRSEGETSRKDPDDSRTEGEYRFAAKIKAEEAREDDRKVDVSKVASGIRSRPAPTGRYTNITPAGLNRDRVLLDVVSNLGVPYLYGGRSKEGMDCSGFTSLVYENAAHRLLPRTVEGQYRTGRDVENDSLQFGDLVFFDTTGESPSHVGIYIEDDLFAHASVGSGVTISSLESTYYRKRYVGARRIVR
jgi:cell wall-associated NlpC family hydrolase